MINLINSIRNDYDVYFYSLSRTIKTDLLKKHNIPYFVSNYISANHTVTVTNNKEWLLFPFKAIIKFFIIILSTIKLVKFIKYYKFDIIHSNSASISSGFFAAKICGIKHVWHLREYIYKGQLTYPIFGFNFLRFLISKSDYNIPISEGIKKFYKVKQLHVYDAVFSKKEVEIAYGNNYNEFILFCGSLGVAKRPEDALFAFKEISNLYPKLRLKIAGFGARLPYLKKLAKELNIDSKVDFLGYVQNTYNLFKNAKCFLMTSTFEGLGRTTIEAMANRCIVVGYNKGGTAEIIKHKETGFLYNNFNELLINLKYVLDSNDDSLNIIKDKAFRWALDNCEEKVYQRAISYIYESLFV